MKTSTLRVFIQKKSWIKLSGRWEKKLEKKNLHCVKLIKENYLEKRTGSWNLSTDMGKQRAEGIAQANIKMLSYKKKKVEERQREEWKFAE